MRSSSGLICFVASAPISVLAATAEACSTVFADRLGDFWLSSGPPLAPEGRAEDCHGLGGVLHELSTTCGEDGGEDVGSSLSTFLLSITDGLPDRPLAASLLTERFAALRRGFGLCAPAACSRVDGVIAASAIVLHIGQGMMSGEQLKGAALTLMSVLQNPGEMTNLMLRCLVTEERSETSRPTLKLNSGFRLPMLAFGTAGLGEKTSSMVQEALRVGFRAVDTATHPEGGEGFDYNQQGVGDALSKTSVPRASLFITSKVHPADLGYQKTIRAVERAVDELGPGAEGYIDLVLIHFPTCDREYCPPNSGMRPLGDFRDAWRGLEETVSRGLVRSIGVSNFDAQQLTQLLPAARVAPAVAGLWADVFHPAPRALIALCKKHAIQLQAFGALGYEWSQGRGAVGQLAARSSPLLDHPQVLTIARKKGWRAADVLIKFFLQQDIAVITGSGRPERIRQIYVGHESGSLSAPELEALHDLEGFLASSLRVQASPDFYAGMVGFDTQELHAFSTTSPPGWDCNALRRGVYQDGVIHLSNFLPAAAVESAQRAAQKVVWDHGGGHWEDGEFYPAALCNEANIPVYMLDTSQINYIFPLVAALGDLAKCLLNTDDPGIFYMLLRAKVRGCNASHIPWHQDSKYLLQTATTKLSIDEAEPQIEEFTERSITMHVPLTSATFEKGAMMYALGSHVHGLDMNYWVPGWLGIFKPPPCEFNDTHHSVRVFEAEPGDVLTHSVMVHHGARPNETPHIRWHVELGVQELSYQPAWEKYRARFPADTSKQSHIQFVREMAALSKSERDFHNA